MAVLLVPALISVSWCQQPTNIDKFTRIAKGGFGDPDNSWAWSMGWFNHKLYVGTGRTDFCMTLLTADVAFGSQVYSIGVAAGYCPQDPKHLSLAGQIWQYTPETHSWVKVFQSPLTIPIGLDQQGNPVSTARDAGFRAMTVFTEPDGTQALYVGGVTSASVYEKIPPYDTQGYPPPRILRTTDGINWTPLPQTPGTFLGNIANPFPGSTRKQRSFRALTPYKGILYATAGDFRGVGTIIASLPSLNPKLGDNAWHQVSPAPEQFPVWNLDVFNNFLYCTTGDRRAQAQNNGYGVFKTDGTTTTDPNSGQDFLSFLPIIQNAGGQSDAELAFGGLSFMEFRGHLYVGTNQKTELVRINKDDTWELIAGDPHVTASGVIAPVTGLGLGFGNFFNAHFWRMAAHNGRLFLGTFDFSFQISLIPQLNGLFNHQYGADFFQTDDGFHWTYGSQNGFGNPPQYGVRSMMDTPLGLFIGTATPLGKGGTVSCPLCGFQVWRYQDNLDLNGDGVIDQNDVNIIMNALNTPATGPNDPRDLDQDGMITVLDARKLVTQCTLPGCATPSPLPPPPVPPPKLLTSVSNQISPNEVILNWQPVAGAANYQVWRATGQPILTFLNGKITSVTIPGLNLTVTLTQIQQGLLDPLCNEQTEQTIGFCDMIEAVKTDFSLPGPFQKIATTTNTFFQEPVPTTGQSLYFVVAVNGQGQASVPSNLQGGPSLALPFTFTRAFAVLNLLVAGNLIDSNLATQLSQALTRAQNDVQINDFTDALNSISSAQSMIQQNLGTQIFDDTGDDLNYLVRGLMSSIQMAVNQLIPVSALL